MPFQGRPYDEALADLDEFSRDVNRWEKKVKVLERQRDDLLAACEAAESLLDLARARLAASAPEEPGYCPACSADELCYNHQQQENLINAIQQLRAAIAAARGNAR